MWIILAIHFYELNNSIDVSDLEDILYFDADEVDQDELLKQMPRFSEPAFDEENDNPGPGISPTELKLSRDIAYVDPLEEEGEDPIMFAGEKNLRSFFIVTGWTELDFPISNWNNSKTIHFWPIIGKANMILALEHLFTFLSAVCLQFFK